MFLLPLFMYTKPCLMCVKALCNLKEQFSTLNARQNPLEELLGNTSAQDPTQDLWSQNLSGVGVEEKHEKLPRWFCLPRLGASAYKCKITLCQQALWLLGISFSGWSSSTFKSSDENLLDCPSHVWGAALFTNLFVLGMPPALWPAEISQLVGKKIKILGHLPSLSCLLVSHYMRILKFN